MEHYDIPKQSLASLSFDESIAIFEDICVELRNTVLQIPPFKDPTEWIQENIDLPKGKTSRPGKLKLTGYPLNGSSARPFEVSGVVHESTPLRQGADEYTIEWSGFRPFNVENVTGNDPRAASE